MANLSLENSFILSCLMEIGRNESADVLISTLCSYIESDIDRLLMIIGLRPEGNIELKRWRIIRYFQRCRGFDVTWNPDEDEINPLEVSRASRENLSSPVKIPISTEPVTSVTQSLIYLQTPISQSTGYLHPSAMPTNISFTDFQIRSPSPRGEDRESNASYDTAPNIINSPVSRSNEEPCRTYVVSSIANRIPFHVIPYEDTVPSPPILTVPTVPNYPQVSNNLLYSQNTTVLQHPTIPQNQNNSSVSNNMSQGPTVPNYCNVSQNPTVSFNPPVLCQSPPMNNLVEQKIQNPPILASNVPLNFQSIPKIERTSPLLDNSRLFSNCTERPQISRSNAYSENVRDLHGIVRRWNIKFSGSRDTSVEEFLTRVDECRSSSHLDDQDLFESMPFLLTDKALHWFRLNRKSWNNWQSFINAFRTRFGGVNFQFRIREEARRRTQGPDEPIADYLLSIRMILNYLEPPMIEREQIELAYSNLHPDYRLLMSRDIFSSFEELESLGEKLESSRALSRFYTPPPSPNDSILPEHAYQIKKSASVRAKVAAIDGNKTADKEKQNKLNSSLTVPSSTDSPLNLKMDFNNSRAYSEVVQSDTGKKENSLNDNPRKVTFSDNRSYKSSSPTVPYRTELPFNEIKNSMPFKNQRFCSTEPSKPNSSSYPLPLMSIKTSPPKSAEISCWNCHKKGHITKECSSPRTRFCYRCGCPNQTVNTCPRCSGNQGGN